MKDIIISIFLNGYTAQRHLLPFCAVAILPFLLFIDTFMMRCLRVRFAPPRTLHYFAFCRWMSAAAVLPPRTQFVHCLPRLFVFAACACFCLRFHARFAFSRLLCWRRCAVYALIRSLLFVFFLRHRAWCCAHRDAGLHLFGSF